ncbi:MAG: transglutaminase domain-containing protein [Planctomycetes bacterium]|nr:transglutaminase domain-containing protein [Planctomycetota bacterium]
MRKPAPLVPFLLAVLLPGALALAQTTTRTFAIRMAGRTLGTMVETERPAQLDGRDAIEFTLRLVAQVELLGAKIEQRVDQTWWLDPATRAVLRLQAKATTGSQTVAVAGRLVDGRFVIDGGETVDPAEVVVAPDYGWLLARGPKTVGQRWTSRALLPDLGGVREITVVLPPDADRELDVLGVATKVRAFDLQVEGNGTDGRVFVALDGALVRQEMAATGFVIERIADGSAGPLERVDLTSTILAPTNLDVPDGSALTFVRLRATIETSSSVTAAQLQVPGQTFEGTVTDGRIDGVFTIRSRRVDATASPPWPPPAGLFAADTLRPWLLPVPNVIQSDDPAIAAKARELAAGAATCLQVVERLGRWCHDEIPYVIPGGGSAKGTFESRQGECGGHSRLLAAMLRSLGIPARTPMGGMYVPLQGGSFAQHMWTEVWLGEPIGWLAVDCTAGQYTFVDATHIRLGDGEVPFRPHAIEVLDYEPGPSAAEASAAVERRSDAFPFDAGTPLVFTWSRGGRELGDERVSVATAADGATVFESSLRLADGAFAETTRTEVGADGSLRSFRAERSDGPQQSTFELAAEAGQVVCTAVVGGEERKDTLPLPAGAFVLHNSCMAHFLVPLSRLAPLAAGAVARVRVFHSEARTTLPMVLRGAGREAIDVGGAEVQAHVVVIELAGLEITTHVDDRGRLLRYHQKQGDVRITLRP